MGNPLGPDRRRALKILHRRQYLAQDSWIEGTDCPLSFARGSDGAGHVGAGEARAAGRLGPERISGSPLRSAEVLKAARHPFIVRLYCAFRRSAKRMPMPASSVAGPSCPGTPGNELALVMECGSRGGGPKHVKPLSPARYCPNGNLNDLIVRMGRPGLSEGLTRKLMAEAGAARDGKRRAELSRAESMWLKSTRMAPG